jgi:histidine triad (HIT) family protein
MDDCVFCKIAEGVIPASVVYSDEKVVAFLDIQPVNPGHVLVIPKAHAKELSELDSEVAGQMFKAAMVVAEGLRKSGVKCEGVTMFLADGEAAFQEVFHVHLHVIPRFRGDGFGLKFGPTYGIKPERKEMDIIAAQIRNNRKKEEMREISPGDSVLPRIC